MSKLIGLAFLFWPLLACADDAIDMSGVKIIVPTPSGMKRASGETIRVGSSSMMQLEHGMYLMAHDSPHTKQLLLYLPQAAAEQGEYLVPARYFVVTTHDKLVGTSISGDDFTNIKKGYRDEIVAMRNKLEKELPGVGARLRRYPLEEVVLQRSLEVVPVVVLGDLEEDSRALTFSGLSRSGGPSNTTPTGWSTFTHANIVLKKRLIFFQTYGSPSDLEWTRTASKQWVEEIVRANR